MEWMTVFWFTLSLSFSFSHRRTRNTTNHTSFRYPEVCAQMTCLLSACSMKGKHWLILFIQIMACLQES